MKKNINKTIFFILIIVACLIATITLTKNETSSKIESSLTSEQSSVKVTTTTTAKATTKKKEKKAKKTTTKTNKTEKDIINIEDYQEEANVIAKIIYNEARGIDSLEEQAAVAWCILNRVDSQDFPNTIITAATQPNQFAWNSNTPVLAEFKIIAEDVIKRWLLEKQGKENVGRVLPQDYLYFYGDGERNHFRKTYKYSATWDWSLSSPYDFEK